MCPAKRQWRASLPLSLSPSSLTPHRSAVYMFMYMYMYTHMFVCVCVCRLFCVPFCDCPFLFLLLFLCHSILLYHDWFRPHGRAFCILPSLMHGHFLRSFLPIFFPFFFPPFLARFNYFTLSFYQMYPFFFSIFRFFNSLYTFVLPHGHMAMGFVRSVRAPLVDCPQKLFRFLFFSRSRCV